MITLNLINNKRKISKKRNFVTIGMYALFGLFVAYFIFEVIFVSVNLYLTSQKLNSVRAESKTVSGEILKDNEKLNNFILSKFILTEINTLRSKEFSYKQFLDQIVAVVPPGNDITSVDFSVKGTVNVGIHSADSGTFRQFESNMRGMSVDKTDFNSVFSNSVSRSTDGTYDSIIVFKIKPKNG